MDTSTPPAVHPPQTPVRWREVALFCALAYGFSWAWWAPQVLPHLGEVLRQGYGPAFFEGGTSAQQNWGVCGMFGPMLAAVVMRLWISRDGFWGSVGILRSWRWYALAAAAPAGEPFALEACYLSAEEFGGLTSSPLGRSSLFSTLERDFGVELAHADEEVDATAADGRIAELLGVPRGAPLLRIRQVIYSTKGKATIYVLGFYRSDRHTLLIRRFR